MTIREITELRKSGKLDEALKGAEAEFAQNQNNYTASALFWCLNDLCKQVTDTERLTATYERMQELYATYCPGDTYMPNSLAALERRLNEHYAEMQEAIARAKAGENVKDVYAKFSKLYDEGQLPETLHGDYGWLTYYALRETVTTDAHASKQMLSRYLRLGLERPSILHSLILTEAVKLERNFAPNFRFRDFIRLWGLENLRQDDWQQFKTDDGKTLSSLVERLINVYAKELKTDGVAPADDFCELMDRALPRFTNNQNMPYFKATMLVALGRDEEAVGYYRQLILKNPNKFYLWVQLSALVDDMDTKVSLLCRAVNTGEDDGFLGAARLRLAQALVATGRYAEAKAEVDRYRQTYESRGWGLKQDFWDVARLVPPNVVAADNRRLYDECSPAADRFIYGTLPSVYAVKVADRRLDDQRRPGRKFTQWTLNTDGKTLSLKKPRKYGLDERAPNGAVFEAKIHGGKIVWIQPAETFPSLPWLKRVSGKVSIRTDRNGNPYTIINHVYVGARLLASVADVDMVTVTAIKGDDGRWSALDIHQ